jgi:hypothetical protein
VLKMLVVPRVVLVSEVVRQEGGCPKCPSLGDGHFGHLRFKFFLKIDFDGHLVGGHERLIDVYIRGTLYSALS